MSDLKISGAVLGSPISHSLSPLLHRAIFSHLGLSLDYRAIEVVSGSLKTFLAENESNFDYFSLTMPLKEEALALSIAIDPLVSRIQSSNTLVKRGAEWNLFSTDGLGFSKAIQSLGHSTFKSALVLGAGGTARAVVGALDGIADEISVLGRTSTRSAVLEASIARSKFSYLRWSDTPDFSPYDLIVNTTPAGAADILANSVTESLIQGKRTQESPALFFDVIYKPWPTVFASRWVDSGGEVLNGIEMLLYQGIAQVEIVLQKTLDYADLANAIRPQLKAALK